MLGLVVHWRVELGTAGCTNGIGTVYMSALGSCIRLVLELAPGSQCI